MALTLIDAANLLAIGLGEEISLEPELYRMKVTEEKHSVIRFQIVITEVIDFGSGNPYMVDLYCGDKLSRKVFTDSEGIMRIMESVRDRDSDRAAS